MSASDIEELLPLSPMQQGMLFHSLYAPQSGQYFEQGTWTLSGPLDVPAFQRAWQHLLDRHMALRAAFLWEGVDRPLQVIYRSVPLEIELLDWTDCTTVQQDTAQQAFLAADLEKGFDLQEAPLMRLTLIRTAPQTHIFVWSHHHLLLDGWSQPVILGDFFQIYTALTQGLEPRLPAPSRYRDYIGWLQEQDPAAAEAAWRQALQGISTPTPLKFAFPAGAAPGEYASQKRLLPSELSAGLRDLTRRRQLTLSTLVQGAWAILLSRCSAEPDVIFGATVSGRPADLPGAESIVGLLINTLPVRARVQPERPCLEWLQDLQARQADLRQYEYCSLVDIQGWSKFPRDLPLFDSLVVYENYPVDPARENTAAGLRIQSGSSYARTNYPLTLAITPGEQIGIQAAYELQSFDPDTIQRLLLHLEVLLEGILQDPDRPVGRLPVMPPVEREQILETWNAARADFPARLCAHQIFEAQVDLAPQAVALVCQGKSMTYLELDSRANQLAHLLRQRGVAPEVCVGVCLERSPELLAACLAVWKTGGVYVPLDPNYPLERLAFMLADAGIRLLITQDSLLDRIPGIDIDLLLVDRDDSLIRQQPLERIPNSAAPENLAYLIYTSGSTGLPKGSLQEHRGLVNFAAAYIRDLGTNPASVVLQFASPSFDASLGEFCLALFAGGRLVLASRDTLLAAPDLARLICDQAVDTIVLPPAVLDLLDPRDLPSLKTVMSVGDVCPLQVVRRWAPHVRFWNGYGPTETTIGATWTQIDPMLDTVTIGRPAANIRVYILDPELQPVPVGVPGELVIGGAGVGRGYLNRPDLTAEKFIPDLFFPAPGARLYRTGDQARWRPDGQIEFIGRLDRQVKIRGLRVELGEIETVLLQHPAVRQAAVLAREDHPGEKCLVAYLVAHPNRDLPDLAELRRHLLERLPAFMIPQAFVWLESLPLLVSGKVDRAALPVPEYCAGPAGQPGLGPRTPVEQAVAELWREILRVPQPRPEDHFFEQGGHSLSAARLVSAVREVFQVDLPIRDLFEAPTLAGFSARVLDQLKQSGLSPAPPIRPTSRGDPLPLSFAQQRLWFLEQLAPGNLFYNLPLAVRLEGELDLDALQSSLDTILARHEILRTRFLERDGQVVQDILPQASLPLQVVDLSALPETEREGDLYNRVQKEVQKPFDLAQGPLLRAGLYRLGPLEHVALLVMHHIISDGWSMGVLFSELTGLYTAFHEGKSSPLPRLPIQYADYAAWQRFWLRGEVLEEQLAYWKKNLAGLPPVLELPTDRPRPAVQTSRGAVLTFQIPPDLAGAARELARDENATIFMILLAVFKVLLARYSGQEDIPVGTALANRTRAEVEGLIGFFVNTLVLRADLSGEPSFRELLERVRETCLGAYAHQDLPFEVLVETLQPQRDLSHNPLFQVMFVLDPPIPESSRLPGLSVTALEAHPGTATFDLTLSLSNAPDGLRGSLEYNTDLWDAATMARLVEHYQAILAAVTRDPEEPLWSLAYLSGAEQSLLLTDWNQTQAPAPLDRCAHQLFEDRARSQPGSPALIFGDRQLSYAELDLRANQLAHYLRGLGVVPESVVGISTDRCLESVIGILGVLKAGGAYLPLDPAYPRDRLAFMLQDSGASLLLTQEFLLERLPEFQGRRICLDTGWDAIAQGPVEPLSSTVGPTHLAYMIYTSGSTGLPKGTLLQHRGLCNLAEAQRKAFRVTGDSRILQFSSFSFDASVWETFMALANGGALVLAPQEILASAPDLYRLLQDQRVSHATLPPSVLQVLPAGDLPDLQVLVAAGEACPAELVERWAPGRRFFNAYGPTETTVCASMYQCQAGEPGLPPIGRPLPNIRLYVLDSHLQLVPVGVPGELLVGGVCLARGYHNRPELTAQKFIRDPFNPDPAARLYRTGDRVRCRPDGNLEFLGRIDQQVKLRGFRIELGEIEAALLQHPAVLQAAAAVKDPDRLQAYIVPRALPAPTPAELRVFLRKFLPEYMLPGGFTILEELPLSPAGKIDRRALPAPDMDRPDQESEYVAPRSPTEERLVEIASGLLGLARVGVYDSFFDLGGHSLLATQFASRVREVFAIELPLRLLFEHPRIADLALDIEQIQSQAAETPLPAIQPVSRAARRVRRSDLNDPLD